MYGFADDDNVPHMPYTTSWVDNEGIMIRVAATCAYLSENGLGSLRLFEWPRHHGNGHGRCVVSTVSSH